MASACRPRKPAEERKASETYMTRTSPRRTAAAPVPYAVTALSRAAPRTSQKCVESCCHCRSSRSESRSTARPSQRQCEQPRAPIVTRRRASSRASVAAGASRSPAGPRRVHQPRRSAFASARYWCTSDTTTEPSPTAEATRLTDPARTSPTAKSPGTDVSCAQAGRSSAQAPASSHVGPGEEEAPPVTHDGVGQPGRVRLRTDHDEEGVGRDRAQLDRSSGRRRRPPTATPRRSRRRPPRSEPR